MGVTVDQLLRKRFLTQVREEQCEIVRAGKPLPLLGPEGDVAHFAPIKYLQTDWLTGCANRGKFFCWPCLLFAAPSPFSTEGVTFDRLDSCKADHEKSTAHTQSVAKLARFTKDNKITVDGKKKKKSSPMESLEDRIMSGAKRLNYPSYKEQEYDALEAYVTLIAYRLKNQRNAPFCKSTLTQESGLKKFHSDDIYMFGNLEDFMKLRCGAFRNLVELHNDMLTACAEVVKDAIKAEVRNSRFVSLIFDDKSEEVENCHMATYLRFAHLTTGELKERFVGFHDLSYDVKKRTADTLYAHFTNLVERYELGDKLISVTVDGMAVNNVELENFMIKVHDAYPRVLYSDFGKLTRLMWGRLRHVGTEAQIFLGILPKLERFIASRGEVILRYEANKPWFEKLYPDGPLHGKYKSRNLTQMTTLIGLVRTEMFNFFRNYSFGILPKKEADYERKKETTAYWRFLKDFGSILLGPFFEHYLKTLETFESKLMEAFDGDWTQSEKLIEEFMSGVAKFKANNFDRIYAEALSTKRIVDQVRLHRCCEHEHMLDDVDEDELDLPGEGGILFEFDWVTPKKIKLDSPSVKKRYSEMLDRLVSTIQDMTRKCRLDTMHAVQFFSLMNPAKVGKFCEAFPDDLLANLDKTFPGLFNVEHLKLELQYLYKENGSATPSVAEIFKFLTQNEGLADAFPQTTGLASLILAIPCRLLSKPPIEPKVTSRTNLLSIYRSKLFEHIRTESEGYLRIECRLFDEINSKDFPGEVVKAFFALRGIDITQYQLTEVFN